ncbi:hypothetical protein GPA23_06145 [Aromatoleum aromaticum]|nr:hypothetical protein [Aromatoleum aromaticum]
MSWETDLAQAPYDEDAAGRLLVHAAGFLERGEALPGALALHFATAFRAAAGQPRNSDKKHPRTSTLGEFLSLKAGNRRGIGSPVGHALAASLRVGSATSISKELASASGRSKRAVDAAIQDGKDELEKLRRDGKDPDAFHAMPKALYPDWL